MAAKVVMFAITPYLANTMGAAEFGSLSLYLSTTDIFSFILFLGGPALVAAQYVRHGEMSALRLRAASIGVSLRVVPVLLVGSIAVSWFWPGTVPYSAGILIVAVSYLYGLNSLELSYYRGAQKYPFAIAGQFCFSVMSLLLTIAAFEWISPTATNRLLSIAIALGLVQLAYAFDLHRHPYDLPDLITRRANINLVVTFGLSVSVHVASQWVRLAVDRFVLAGHAGLATAGVYSVALSMATVPSVLFNIISQQLQPYMYRKLKENKFGDFRRIQVIFTLFVATSTSLYYWILLKFFDTFFGSEYSSAKTLLLPLLGASAAQSAYYIFTHAAFYERRARHISGTAAATITVHLLGLGALALAGAVTPLNVSLVYLISGVTTAVGMATLSRITVKQLASNGEVSH